MRARATADAVTAPLARRLPRAARPRSRGPAPLRPTCHQAQRLARRSSRPEHAQVFGPSGGPASGTAGGRGDDRARAQQTKCSGVREQRASSSSGRAERMAVAYPRRPSASPRSPATGRAAFVITAGAAGQTASREGWKPGRVETRRGSMRSTTAWHRAAGTRPAVNKTATTRSPLQHHRMCANYHRRHRPRPPASVHTNAYLGVSTVVYRKPPAGSPAELPTPATPEPGASPVADPSTSTL